MNEYQQAIDLLAFIQRHPGHASQKPHGRRYGASGEVLPSGHKRKDVVTGGSKAAQGRGKGGGASQEAAKSYDFPKDDKGIRQHYDLKSNCKSNKDACKGIADYTYDDSSVINNHLRGKLKGNDSIAHQNKVRSAQETVKRLDKAFEVMPRVPEDMKVARFVSSDVANMLNPGTSFKDKGFVSTTIKSDLEFESYDGKSDWKIHINVAKGSKGIYVKDQSTRKYENELLLPRGSEMKVTGKDPKTKTIYADYQ